MVSRLDDLIPVKARGIHRILNGAGLTVECVRGALWITQAGDERDVTLQAGEHFRLDRDGLAVVYGLEPAVFSLLTEPRAGRRSPVAVPPEIRAA